MNIKGFRRMLFGEKMPDKNDPQYKERYERDIERNLFLIIVFAFVLGGLLWNIYRISVVYRHQPVQRTATEMQDSVLKERRKVFYTPSEHNSSKAEEKSP